MTDRPESEPATSPVNLAPLDEALALIREAGIEEALGAVAPALAPGERADLARHCELAHAAVLLSAPSEPVLRAAVRSRGLEVGSSRPSTVVRQRLADRYGLAPRELEVSILSAPVPGPGGRPREVEVFALVAPHGSPARRVAEREAVERGEEHLALRVVRPDRVVLDGLRVLLTGAGGMRPDGGGYNAHEDGTVLYFRAGSGGGPALRRRLELYARGAHPQVLAAHLEEPAVEPERRLLELMTGAWTSQSIAVAARPGLADLLPAPAEPASSVGELAERAGADPDGLGRLLRHLSALGIAARDDGGYRLGPLGASLRSDVPHSLRPLALLYGGPFHDSFADLDHAVRTGREAFAHRFGRGHFEHFSADPELSVLFDRAMAAGAAMFAPVAEAVAASRARVVVDVAGRDGELLRGVLTRAPATRGVLLEREAVARAARARLAAAGLADRCEVVSGDFTRTVPGGGDVYVLSRVLHDWDDGFCADLLERCARAIPAHAELLVVERLLPEDERPSLAVPWDLHMLCDVGGRERALGHYEQLPATAGPRVTEVRPLPLDGHLLRASWPEPGGAPAEREVRA
ncbi:methyltransferase [Kitasatospora sp. NPDC057541]|uniref:methyltransferase n=1 Tax=unclassified Kitasatospora TaxID=2633591 RepID=UPI0036D0A6E5